MVNDKSMHDGKGLTQAMRIRTKLIAATAASGALALGAPTVAYADGIVSDNNIGANVCGTDVNILAEESGRTNCVNKIRGNEGDEGGILSGNNIAANVCGTDVNVAAEESGRTNCVNKINAKDKKHEKKHEKEKKAPEEKPEEVEEAAPAQPIEEAPEFAG